MTLFMGWRERVLTLLGVMYSSNIATEKTVYDQLASTRSVFLLIIGYFKNKKKN
jgi:hypothetical protein